MGKIINIDISLPAGREGGAWASWPERGGSQRVESGRYHFSDSVICISLICWHVFLVFCKPYFSGGVGGAWPVLLAQSKPAWERAGSQRVESGRYQQWPTASDGQSLPVAFTHCHNYFHFPYFSPFYFCFLSNLNIKKEVCGCLSVRKYVCKHFSQILSLSLLLSFLLLLSILLS